MVTWWEKRFKFLAPLETYQALERFPKPFAHDSFRVVVYNTAIPPVVMYVGKLSKSLLQTLCKKWAGVMLTVHFFDRSGTFAVYRWTPYSAEYKGTYGDPRLAARNVDVFNKWLIRKNIDTTFFELVNR